MDIPWRRGWVETTSHFGYDPAEDAAVRSRARARASGTPDALVADYEVGTASVVDANAAKAALDARSAEDADQKIADAASDAAVQTLANWTTLALSKTKTDFSAATALGFCCFAPEVGGRCGVCEAIAPPWAGRQRCLLCVLNALSKNFGET